MGRVVLLLPWVPNPAMGRNKIVTNLLRMTYIVLNQTASLRLERTNVNGAVINQRAKFPLRLLHLLVVHHHQGF